MYAWLFVRLNAFLCSSFWMTRWFMVTRVHLHLNDIHLCLYFVLTKQWPGIQVKARWVCVRGFVQDLQEQGVALRFNNAQHSIGVVCPQEALLLITHSVRQSQIVSDYMITVPTDMNRESVRKRGCQRLTSSVVESLLVSILACVTLAREKHPLSFSAIWRSFSASPSVFIWDSFSLFRLFTPSVSLSVSLFLSLSLSSQCIFFAFSLVLLWWHPLVSVWVCLWEGPWCMKKRHGRTVETQRRREKWYISVWLKANGCKSQRKRQ